MSSFPDVLSATLTYSYGVGPNQPRIFTVPSQYAFAVVQVVITYVPSSTTGSVVLTPGIRSEVVI